MAFDEIERTILQMIPAQPGWRATWYSRTTGQMIAEPVICWALVHVVVRDIDGFEQYHEVVALTPFNGGIDILEARSNTRYRFLGLDGDSVDRSDEYAQIIAEEHAQTVAAPPCSNCGCCPAEPGSDICVHCRPRT